MMVSGMRIIEPEAAERLGYHPWFVILPDEPRPPTDEEFERIIATAETDIRIQFCNIPRSIFETADRSWSDPDFWQTPEPMRTIDLGRNIPATMTDFRRNAPGQLTVSAIGSRAIDGRSTFAKIGSHIDAYADREVVFMVVNGGEGSRWHLFSPWVTRTAMGEDVCYGDAAHGLCRTPYIQELSQVTRAMFVHKVGADIPGTCCLYWLRLDGPGFDRRLGVESVEALLNCPIAEAMHDGSTWGGSQPSKVAFITAGKIPEGTWPSALVPFPAPS
jgi:hypothetical protein